MNIPLITQDILNRLERIREFHNNQAAGNNEPAPALSIDNYRPQVLAKFNFDWRRLTNHLDINLYRAGTTVPATQIPYYTEPIQDQEFPVVADDYIQEPDYINFFPALVAAQEVREDFRAYDIISERSSLRKVGMNKDKYVIGVMCHRSKLLLRRYENQPFNRNDIGHLFERMCTPGFAADVEYQHLIGGQIGTLKTLITSQIDAVSTENNGSIELKCREQELRPEKIRDIWFQMFLSKFDDSV